MTLFLGLVRHQCRVLAAVGLTGLAVALAVACMAQLAAGVDPAVALRPAALGQLLVVLLPEVLQVVLPVSVAHAILSLEEGGELRATHTAGVGPGRVALALAVPVLPLLAALPPLVHGARPAALAGVRVAAANGEATLERGLAEQGIGMVREAAGLRLLLPLGKAAVAVATGAERLRRSAGDGHRLVLRDGVVKVLGGSGALRSWHFAAADLAHAPVRPGLDALSEKELSTAFLATSAMQWRRSRLDWGSARSGELVRQELGRRALVLPATGLGLLLCLWLLFLRSGRSVAVVHGVCTPLAVVVSLFLPRWLA